MDIQTTQQPALAKKLPASVAFLPPPKILLIKRQFLTKMETILGKEIQDFPALKSFIRIGDIENFEGPLLTLFENTNKRLFLFDWIDNDDTFNRWLVYTPKAENILKYINKQLSHYELIMSVSNDFIIVEIDKNLQIHSAKKVSKNNLPSTYLPDKDAVFDSTDCPHFEKTKVFLEFEIMAQTPSIINKPRKHSIKYKYNSL